MVQRSASLVLSLFAAALVVTLALACPKAPACGDGVVQAGETEATCCADTGCAFGACVQNACTAPWAAACASAGAGACTGSFVCGDDVTAPPAYDCATCGCSGGDACSDGVCASAELRGLARTATSVPADLDLPEYTRLYSDLAAARTSLLTVAEWSAQVSAAMHTDPRVNTVVLGALPGSDTGTVSDAILAGLDFQPASVLAVDAQLDAPGDACAAVAASSSTSLLPAALTIATVGDDEATHITCPYLGTYASCTLPQVDACVERAGRIAVSAAVLDLKVTMPILDEALLVRCGHAPQAQRGQFLDLALNAFTVAAAVVGAEAGLAVGDRFVAVYPQDASGLASFVVLADPAATPVRVGTFRAVWSDPAAQTFLVDHDVQTADCTFDLSAPVVAMHCARGAASLDAHVDSADFHLVDVTTSP